MRYNGLKRREYRDIEPEIDEMNRSALRVCSFISICIFGTMILYTLQSPHVLYEGNFVSYIIGLLFGAAMLFIALRYKRTKYNIHSLFGICWIVFMICLSIKMAVIPESIQERTTVYLALPVVCTTLYCFPGYIVALLLTGTEIVFIVTIYILQREYPVFLTNLVNSLIFYVIGMIACIASAVIRVKSISNSKKTAAAEAANDAKTSFLFTMSHDIRTPMNAIIGFRKLLEKYQDDPVKRANYLNKIDQSSQVLLSIINNVLEMARIEKGRVEVVATPRKHQKIQQYVFYRLRRDDVTEGTEVRGETRYRTQSHLF